MASKIALAIHGGAGTILRETMTAELEQEYRNGLKNALDAGYGILEKGGSALDAVEAAVKSLEDFPLFNAGRGSVFNHDGKHEMDASIMSGKDLSAGAVAGINNVRNPVNLARLVMEKSDHVFLAGKGAELFAIVQDVSLENDDYFFVQQRYDQLQEAIKEDRIVLDHVRKKKFGTVGAVALDQNGNLAAATSTGGMTNKRFGRVGDSPVIGAGTYANNETCAVSCTGHGELFLRAVVAHDIHCLMAYKNLSLEDACNDLVHNKLMKIKGEGGLIAVDKDGNISMPFNSDGMYRACKDGEGREEVMIYK